ncbi:hypothetical protein H4R34_002357 [Dimargaris verticillata]|uniref:RRM domain-containing protein n=1 Tax=Dimargaris verticillata TaxID=2761393 RepID=A0A9W8EA23_9FUNG|nr:hypothetical protein H4R34_002357 [Dimargaris verticillata]
MPRLYVGGLPIDARPRDVEKLFRDYGEISDIDLKGRFGFVELRSRRDAEDAIHDLDGVRFLGGRVSVEFSRAQRRERGG